MYTHVCVCMYVCVLVILYPGLGLRKTAKIGLILSLEKVKENGS